MEVGLRKDRLPPQFQEIENSGIETNPENVAKRVEGQLAEIGVGPHFESGSISNEERLPK